MTDQRIHVFSSPKCNNNCIFCMEQVPSGKHEAINQTSIKGSLNTLYNKGARNILFTGTEPTMNESLPGMIGLAKSIGFTEIGIQTNGRRLSYKGYLQKLINSGLNLVSVSIHGHTAEIHDALTRSPGSFTQVSEALHLLSKMKSQHDLRLVTTSTITKTNLPVMREIVDFLSEFDLDSVVFNPVIPQGRAKKYLKYVVPSYSEMASMLEKILPDYKHVCLNGFPRCLFGNFKIKGSKEQVISIYNNNPPQYLSSDFGKVKTEKCTGCKLNKNCEGLWRSYYDIFGDRELNPK